MLIPVSDSEAVVECTFDHSQCKVKQKARYVAAKPCGIRAADPQLSASLACLGHRPAQLRQLTRVATTVCIADQLGKSIPDCHRLDVGIQDVHTFRGGQPVMVSLQLIWRLC